MKWKRPPVIKIYEALGAVADGRVKVSGNTATVLSSSGGKVYDVFYDPKKRAIMANDNGSYWQGYLGYPSIAFFLETSVLEYKLELAKSLKGIPWKELNTKFKNDYEKTLQEIEDMLGEEKSEMLGAYAKKLDREIGELDLAILGEKKKPPQEKT